MIIVMFDGQYDPRLVPYLAIYLPLFPKLTYISVYLQIETDYYIKHMSDI